MIIILINDDYTYVHTLNKGIILLKDLQVGDLVYTNNLKYTKVTEIIKQPYTDKIYYLWLHRQVPLCVTEKQEILMLPWDTITKFNNYPHCSFFKDNVDASIQYTNMHARDYDLSWIKAEDIYAKDLSVIPVNFDYTDDPLIFDLNIYKSPRGVMKFINTQIELDKEFLIFLGYIYACAEVDENKICHIHIHKAFPEVKQWFTKYVKDTFNIQFVTYNDIMFYDLTTQHLNFVIMVKSLLENGLPKIINQLHPKIQLYIFKGIFYLLQDEWVLYYYSHNIRVIYDLTNILLRNYIDAPILIRKGQYRIHILKRDHRAFNKFVFNNNLEELYIVNILEFTTWRFPINWNNINYMRQGIHVKKSYVPEKPVEAVQIVTKDNSPIRINSIIIK